MKGSKILFFAITAVMMAVFIGGAAMFFMNRESGPNRNPEEDDYLPAESFDETTYIFQDEVLLRDKNTETHIYTPKEKNEERPVIEENKGTSLIVGGADGPTSIYLAPKTDTANEKQQDKNGIKDREYTAVIDRVLNKYNFEPVDWNNTIDWKEDADILVKMAEENKGRYKAYGIISKEAGTYGIVLIDTVDLTEMNTNYVYEKWFYTGNSDREPKMKWDKSRLYFTYPIPSGTGYSLKTVQIDCGYDSGHMEIIE